MAGCLSQRYQQHLWDDLPEVDAMVGTGEFHRIVDAVDGALKGARPGFWGEMPVSGIDSPRRLTTPFYTAYLKLPRVAIIHRFLRDPDDARRIS